MSIICPTILAGDAHEYREQIERVSPFAKRIQIDLMDGEFAPTKSVQLEKIWWPQGILADIHLMYQKPNDFLGILVKLKPSMVIIHYEAEVEHVHFANELHRYGIRAGLSLLKDTTVDEVGNLLRYFDHVLVFSGDLGRFGGQADLAQLEKVAEIRRIRPGIEIGWDGGVNDSNVSKLTKGGVDVLNVGGFIQNAADPHKTYGIMESLIR